MGVGVLGAAVGLNAGTSRARAVQSSPIRPKSVDVVVIGGGYVGTLAALTLAERGVSVALCEKGVIAGEASGRSMGYVDSQLLDPIKLPLVMRSKQLWAQMNARIGADTGYRPTGLIQSLGIPEMHAAAQRWLEAIRGMPEMDARILTGQQLADLLPSMRDVPDAALYTPTDASVEPQWAAPAIAEAARSRGALILQECAIRGIELQAGRVSGVVTEQGRITCHSVIVAAGTWTPVLMKTLAVSLPQLDVYLSMMSVTGIKQGPMIPFSAGTYGYRPHADGDWSIGAVDFAAPIDLTTIRQFRRLLPAIKAFWPVARVGFSPAQIWRDRSRLRPRRGDQVSPFEKQRVLVPDYRAGPVGRAFKQLCHHFPVFEAATIKDQWSGIVSSTPDNLPLIGNVNSVPGVFIGSALTFGLTMGPAAAEALADLSTGRTPGLDLHPYRVERFTDGSPVVYRA